MDPFDSQLLPPPQPEETARAFIIARRELTPIETEEPRRARRGSIIGGAVLILLVSIGVTVASAKLAQRFSTELPLATTKLPLVRVVHHPERSAFFDDLSSYRIKIVADKESTRKLWTKGREFQLFTIRTH